MRLVSVSKAVWELVLDLFEALVLISGLVLATVVLVGTAYVGFGYVGLTFPVVGMATWGTILGLITIRNTWRVVREAVNSVRWLRNRDEELAEDVIRALQEAIAGQATEEPEWSQVGVDDDETANPS